MRRQVSVYPDPAVADFRGQGGGGRMRGNERKIWRLALVVFVRVC